MQSQVVGRRAIRVDQKEYDLRKVKTEAGRTNGGAARRQTRRASQQGRYPLKQNSAFDDPDVVCAGRTISNNESFRVALSSI